MLHDDLSDDLFASQSSILEFGHHLQGLAVELLFDRGGVGIVEEIARFCGIDLAIVEDIESFFSAGDMGLVRIVEGKGIGVAVRINASPVEWEVEEREGVGAIVSACLKGGAEVFSLAGGGDG